MFVEKIDDLFNGVVDSSNTFGSYSVSDLNFEEIAIGNPVGIILNLLQLRDDVLGLSVELC